MNRDMSFRYMYLPALQPTSFAAALLCWETTNKMLSGHLLLVTLGLHPTSLFLVQTGKNKESLKIATKVTSPPTHVPSLPAHAQIRPFQAICPCPLHEVTCCCGPVPHPEDSADPGAGSRPTAAPSAVDLRKHMSRILRVWDRDLLFPEH